MSVGLLYVLTEANNHVGWFWLLLPEEVLVGEIREHDEKGEHQERYNRLPQVDVVRCDAHQYDQQPHVGEDAEERGYRKHLELLDAPDLRGRYGDDAHRGDHQQVKRGRADDRARTQLLRLHVVPDDAHDREEDLWGARTQRHQRQVGDRVIPDFHLHLLDARLRVGARDLNRRHLARDLLDGAHEGVGDDRDPEEAPE